jgi:hypothetical protein
MVPKIVGTLEVVYGAMDSLACRSDVVFIETSPFEGARQPLSAPWSGRANPGTFPGVNELFCFGSRADGLLPWF